MCIQTISKYTRSILMGILLVRLALHLICYVCTEYTILYSNKNSSDCQWRPRKKKKKPKKKQTEICACLWITAAHVGIYFAAAIIAAVFFMYFCSMSSCSNIHQNDEMPRPRCNIIPSPEFCMRSYNDAKSRNS